ncbi:hypothetical protein RchiOBHm_Chr6g0262561 [Rosa chinensis]|uniref:Uncharacterized protein n=1 Tax=Rosa chinensis TaxID=74649 RepID=A0A2P6PNQ8_ROSCH|nr:hypothetical protein RchiOBHm_Chr6g0262561 [Rosa chinensis]
MRMKRVTKKMDMTIVRHKMLVVTLIFNKTTTARHKMLVACFISKMTSMFHQRRLGE